MLKLFFFFLNGIALEENNNNNSMFPCRSRNGDKCCPSPITSDLNILVNILLLTYVQANNRSRGNDTLFQAQQGKIF